MNGFQLEFDVPANGRFRKATVTAIDTLNGKVKLTDKADMESVQERGKLCKRLADNLPGAKLKDVTKEVEAGWNAAVQKRREEGQAREAAAASQAKTEEDVDPEADGIRRLAETPADVRAEAEDLLRAPDLIDLVSDDIELQGVAGEKELAVTLYLVFTSRKLHRPLAARVRGPSTSGKSHVIDCVAMLMPPEEMIRATQMSPQALFYMKPGSLRHKLIVAGERSRSNDDEAAEATRALREMISAGRLSKLLPVKIGNVLETKLIEQEGPIAFVESTTLGNVFPEDENRAVPLFTDERPDQTRRIIEALGAGYAGATVNGRNPDRVRLIHQTAQRMLKRRTVVIPFAPRLGTLLAADRVEARRAFPAIMSMVQASALLHQFQREQTPNGCLIAVRRDYEIAALLLAGPMRRQLGSGLSEPARRFADRLRRWFSFAEFTTKDAKAKEETSRRSVYGWISELREAGVVETAEPQHGNKGAKYRLTPGGSSEDDPSVLPTAAAVFAGHVDDELTPPAAHCTHAITIMPETT